MDLKDVQSKDVQSMINVLKDMGIEEYEPRVLNQLLEFSYRYVTTLLDEAKSYSSHAGKKTIDADDVKLAVKSKIDHSFTSTPPREFLIEISRTKNKNPLPQIKYHPGLRLPPDRFCLHSANYTLKSQKPAQPLKTATSFVAQKSVTSVASPGGGSNQSRLANESSMMNQYQQSLPSAKRRREDEDDYDA